MTERFYIRKARIHDRQNESEFLTLRDVCELLNKLYDSWKYTLRGKDVYLHQLGVVEAENERLKQLLTECEKEFRKYDGRKLFDLEFIVYAEILGKLTEVLDPK